MKQRRYPKLPALAFLVTAFMGAAPVWAETPSAKEPAATVRKTEEGLHFDVPPDWPIEKRGGVIGPIPIEEYLGRKFQALTSQLQALEQRFNGFDVRLRVMEEEMKKQKQGLRSGGEPAQPE